jgi:hypothetical protein
MQQSLLRSVFTALLALAFVRLCSMVAGAQTPQLPPHEDPRLTLTVEAFCSDTKLRTSDARIRWTMPSDALEAAGVRDLATARQILETTVYKNGFEKGLLVSVPVAQATPEKPIRAQAQGRNAAVRAFQFSLIQIEQQKARGDGGPMQMGALVEGLEPGVNYTWRIAIQTASGKIVSPSVTNQAMVCTADMAPTPSVRKRRKP